MAGAARPFELNFGKDVDLTVICKLISEYVLLR